MTDPRQYHWYQTCVQCTGVSGAQPEGVGEGVELCDAEPSTIPCIRVPTVKIIQCPEHLK